MVQLKSELQNLESRAGRIQVGMNEAKELLATEEVQKAAEEEKLQATRAEYQALEQSRRQLEEEAERLENDSRELGVHLEGTLTELHQKQSRYEVLETLEENLEGVGRGVRELLGREAELAALGDVHGLLATLVRVEREYALAVEAALGPHAQAMVVETQDGALGLLEIARREDLGAVEVICMDRVDVVPTEEYPPHEGVLGRLRDKIDVPAELAGVFSPVLDRLLANVLLVNDFPTRDRARAERAASLPPRHAAGRGDRALGRALAEWRDGSRPDLEAERDGGALLRGDPPAERRSRGRGSDSNRSARRSRARERRSRSCRRGCRSSPAR